jgi:uncharacterized protein
MKLKLSPVDRLLISMHLRKMAEEEPSGGYAVQASIIEHGYTSLYGEVFGMTAEPELSEAVQEEVFDILDMFRALHPGLAAGEKWDPKGDRYFQKFRGFDGNDDGGHYGFARFLIKENRRFEESDGELNSHGSTLETYRAMHARWDGMGRPHQMTQDAIKIVVGAE